MPRRKYTAAEIREMADKLADTGDYSDWWAIEAQLRADGLAKARQVLDNEDVRERLNQRCKAAKFKVSPDSN